MSNQVGGGWRKSDYSSNYSPNITFLDRDPTVYDVKGYKVGDEIINTFNLSWWKLVDATGNSTSAGPLANWVQVNSQGGAINRISGDLGGVVPTLNEVNFTATRIAGASVQFIGGFVFPYQMQLAFSLNGNTMLGLNAGNLSSFPIDNTAVGVSALAQISNGSTNLVLGYEAGVNYTGKESNNILLLHTGVLGESNVIRIGTQGSGPGEQNTAYVAGIYGVTPTGTLQVVTINSSGQLGSEPASSTGIQTIDGDTGSATGSTITLSALNGANNSGQTVDFSASGSTVVFNVTDAFSNTIIGQNSSQNFRSSGNAGNTLIGSAIQLTSGTSINGNAIVGENVVLNASSSIDNNAIVGTNINISSASFGIDYSCIFGSNIQFPNVYYFPGGVYIGSGIGNAAVNSYIYGNICVGSSIFSASSTPGSSGMHGNTLIGDACAQKLTGNFNVFVGNNAGSQMIGGSSNTLIGGGGPVGNNYTGNESNNILIGNNVLGTLGESNVMRLGDTTSLTATYIAGISGINVGSTANVVSINTANDQLGTTAITAGTGISVTPGANTITIAATGTTTLNYTAVTTSPYVVVTNDDFLGVTTSTIAITVQLPNAPATGRIYTIKDATGNAATNTITVTTVGGSVTIDGSTSYVMNTAFESINVLFNGTSYLIF